MDGIPVLDLWDVLIKVLHSSHCRKEKNDDNVPRSRAPSDIPSTNSNIKPKRSSNRDVDELSNVDHVVTNAIRIPVAHL